MKLKVVSLKDSGNEDMALNNCIYMSSKLTRNPNSVVSVKIHNKILKCMFSTDLEVDRMAASKNIRQYLGIQRDQEIMVDKYDVPESNQPILADLQLNISLIKPKNQSIKDFNSQKAIYMIRKMQIGFFFNINENKYFKLNDKTYSAKVVATNLAMSKDIKINSKNVSGRLQEATQIKINLPQTPSGKIKQPKSKKQENQGALLFKPGFNVQDLGIGGLDEELFNIFRRIFSSRRFSQDAIKRFGIKHVKGIILYGPPGTGKTLIAKKLAQCLNVKDLKIVNGPEIFSKFMGQSEQNIRKLFIEARQDEKRLGDKSELHIIVFDEIDAICKQRGMGGSTGSQVSDQVVNQLLTNIDGVDSLNNIIVIGMTNRKDLLDQAILRPGRFEVHIQVSLPNRIGRQQIFNIHTQTLRQNKLLMKNCQIQELARLTKNYTGAQIQGLVKCASSYSISRTTNILDFEKQLVIDESKLGVEMQDFLKALDEVKPQFGVDEETFNSYLNFKIINYGGSFDFITDNLRQSALMKNDESSQIKSILLRGPNGTGKTTHTISFSKSANFSYLKLISAQNYIGMSDSQKVHAIQKVFEDAYKTQQACIIVDNLQSIVQYSNIGRKFSNDVLQTLLILIGRIPPSSSCKLLIIGTTAYYDELSQLGLLSRFDHKIEIPVLQSPEIKNLLIDKFAMSVQSSQKIAELLKGSSIRTVIQLAQLVSSREDIQQWQFYLTTLIKPPKGNTIKMI